jgi:hypothetical protein
VLYRTNGQARELELACLAAGLPYHVRGDGTALTRAEVRDVLAYLRLVHNPRDTAALGRAINTPPRRLAGLARRLRAGEELTLDRLAETFPCGVAGAAACQPLRSFLDTLATLRGLQDRPPAALIEAVLERTGYREWLARQDDGEARLAHVEALRLLAERSEAPDLAGFLDALSLAGDLERDARGASARWCSSTCPRPPTGRTSSACTSPGGGVSRASSTWRSWRRPATASPARRSRRRSRGRCSTPSWTAPAREEIFPDAAAEILAAEQPGATREQARVWAFLHWVEAELFPVYELEDYDQVAWAIPFIRDGWSYDRLHELDLPPGRLLLLALCAQPVPTGMDSRLPLLDGAERYVPRSLLLEVPDGGLEPPALHERLDGTAYAGAAAFADWLWGETGTVFLDLDDEVEVSDADWTREIVDELARQWRIATVLLDRVDALAAWLEADPPVRFARLLDAALGRDARLEYERLRRLHVCEITEAGLVPIPRDHDAEPGPLPLPMGAAG